jgi:DNA-binding transcriptional regulator YiaG
MDNAVWPLKTLQLSRLVGVTQKSVQNWLSGRVRPSALSRRRLAELHILLEVPQRRPKPRKRRR